MSPEAWIALGGLAVAGIVWLVRLEGQARRLAERVSSIEAAADTAQTQRQNERDAIVRLEEQMKFVIQGIERLEDKLTQLAMTGPKRRTPQP